MLRTLSRHKETDKSAIFVLVNVEKRGKKEEEGTDEGTDSRGRGSGRGISGVEPDRKRRHRVAPSRDLVTPGKRAVP